MIVKSLEIIKVSTKLRSCIFPLILMLLETFCLFLKFFASMGHSVMISPFFETEPAKLMRALSTENVVAPLVFFNGLTALHIWTHFGVEQNPVETCGLVRALIAPSFKHLTVRWSMLLLATLEAELVSTFAINNLFVIRNPFDCKMTDLSEGTPFDILVVINKGLAVPPLISFEDRKVLEKVNHH